MVTVQGDSKPIVRNVMTLDTCAPIVGSEVMSFKTEVELLRVGSAATYQASTPGEESRIL